MAKSRSRKRKPKGRTSRRAGATRFGKIPKHAVTLIAILRAKEGQDVLLEAELRALSGPTRREEGCLRYDLYRSADGPGSFLLHEVWESRDHHTRHTKTPHFLRWNARKDTLITSRDAAFWTQIG
jgi:quinol monooxygenase YgiN